LILLPISDFVIDETISEIELQTLTGSLRVNYYPYKGEIIWGATAMILSELIEILKRSDVVNLSDSELCQGH